MARRRAIVVAGLGLVGLTAPADEFGWRPAASPQPAVQPVGQVEPAPAPPAPADVWQPVRPLTDNPVRAADPVGELVFRPATSLLMPAQQTQPAEPPGVAVIVPVIPVIPPTAMPPLPLTTPRPLTFSDGPKADPKPLESAPPPKNGSEPLAAPRVDSTASGSPAQVWGGYGPHPGAGPGPVVTAGGTGVPPSRHRVFGSEDITLSRDNHFLDLWGSEAADEARADRQGRIAAAMADRGGPATDRFLVQTEYLLWWVQPAKIPALATTGTPESQGILGRPGTQLLLGPGSFGNTARNGFRIRGGWWFDDHSPGLGIDGSYFFLGNQSSNQTFTSDQFPVLSRPFFSPNAVPGTGLPGEFAERVASPGRSAGSLVIDTDSELWGADLNFKCCVCRQCNYQSAWFGGFRFLGLEESLTITENIIGLAGNPDPPGTTTIVQDSFATRNRFYGAQIGYMLFRRWGRVSFDGRGSLALGVTNQELDINGFQRTQRPGQPPQLFRGGLLAVGPNLGGFSNATFSAVPEVTLNFGYQVTPTLRGYVGYNFLYWPNVVRPGDQIDRVVDLSFVPNSQMNGQPIPFSGVARPQATFNQTDLWIQGVQFGAELRW